MDTIYENEQDARASLLTASEAARALRVSTRTIHRWIRRGALRGVRLPGRGGGEWKVHRDAVDALLTHGIARRSNGNRFEAVPRCAATNASGAKCQGLAVKGTKYCRHHQEAGAK